MGATGGHSRSWSRTLPAGPDTGTEARWFLREALKDEEPSWDMDVAALLTTEIAGNASRHGVEPIEMTVDLGDEDDLRVSLRDVGPGFDPEQPLPAGALGISLVHALAQDWGVERGEQGTEVWFKLPPASS